MTVNTSAEAQLRRAIAKLDVAIEVQAKQLDRLRVARANARRALELLTEAEATGLPPEASE